MNSSFSRQLALLRQERGMSQRAVASDLNISQALLSHYENGIREPGLDFIVKACNYYDVSADFLLGRTMTRDGTMLSVDELEDYGTSKDSMLDGSMMAMLSKKLLINALLIVFDILSKTGDRDLIMEASVYISIAMYRVFHFLYKASGGNPDKFFSVPDSAFSYCSDAEMKLTEMKFFSLLTERGRGKGKASDFPDLSSDTLERNYPDQYKSLLLMLHLAGDRIGKHFTCQGDAKRFM